MSDLPDIYISNPLTALGDTDLIYAVDTPGVGEKDGAIAFSDLLAQLGGLLYNTATVTTGNVAAVEGNHYDLTIAGLDAERKFTLPTPSAAGVRCSFRILDGDDTYSIMPTANGVDLDGQNCFIAGESIIYRATGTGAADWVIAEGGDGRIACVGVIERTAAQTITTATSTKLLADDNPIDRGDITDIVTNDRINIRRAGEYSTDVFGSITDLGVDKQTSVSLYLDGVQEYSASLATPIITSTRQQRAKKLSLVVGNYVEIYIFHNHGSDRDTGTTTNSPSLSVNELL